MTPAVSLNLQSVHLGARQILQPLSLDVAPGELVALVGPNGAGKTTLLRTMAGLLPYKGSLSLAGVDAATLTPQERARALSYLAQDGNIHWPLKVRDLVALGRLPFTQAGANLSAQNKAQIDSILHTCCLDHLSERRADALSGGERARVLLARALVVDAPLVLADEPVAALDPALQLATMQILADQAATGKAIMVVMHDLNLALRFATRCVALAEGQIQADGAPLDLLDKKQLGPIFGLDFVHTHAEGIPLLAPRVRMG